MGGVGWGNRDSDIAPGLCPEHLGEERQVTERGGRVGRAGVLGGGGEVLKFSVTPEGSV